MTEFYQDQNVVVLGGAGFVGQHLCRLLESRGANVYTVDNYSRHGGLEIGPDFNRKSAHLLDIRYKLGLDTLRLRLQNINPFAVFNLAAAVANVEYNQTHHNQMFLDNVQLQTIPVEVCEKLGVPHFLQVSSACVYGEDANAPAIESNLGGEPVGANSGYSWAKRMGERAIQWSGLPHAVIVRPSNIYGPGDWYDERAHVIPKLIKGYDEGTAKMFGDGSPVRQFIYVEDAARGMIHALEFGEHKEAYNLAPRNYGGTITIIKLHKLISDMMKKEIAPNTKATFDPGDDRRYSDGLKLRQLGGGWICGKPFLHNGLEETIEAYLGNNQNK